MLDKYKNKGALCQCVDWSGEDGTDFIDHLLHNYAFDRLALDYSTLDKDSEIRLCQIGHCSKCGGQICIGTVIHPCELLDDTLARIYAEASRRWRWYHDDGNFGDEFVQMFRGRDQQVARLWLNLVRTKTVVQHADYPYVFVICKVRKRDTGKFLEALAKLPNKMLLCGHPDYIDFCHELRAEFDSAAAEEAG